MNYFYLALTQLLVMLVYEVLRYFFWRLMQARKLRRMEQMDLGVQNLLQALKKSERTLPRV